MLQSIKIENIAVIQSAEIELSGGFNVLTGETGAGKSIIIDSINAVLGERTSRDVIRSGASEAYVTALFTGCGEKAFGALKELDIDDDGGEIVITRRISADGKSSCRVNGVPVTASMLKALGRELVNIHGQHDSQALLMPDKHYAFLDIVAGNSPLLDEYHAQYNRLVSLKKELLSLRMDDSEKTRRLDMLNYQIDELKLSRIRPGEREELTAKKKLFRNAEKVISALRFACEELSGGEDSAGAAEKARSAADSIDCASEYFYGLSDTAEKLRGFSYEIDDFALQINEALSQIDIDPSDMENVDERLDTLYRLSRKYGATEEDMLDYLKKAEAERESIVLSEQRISELERELEITEKNAVSLAGKLTESRRKAAVKFEKDVRAELDFLDMPGVRFAVKIEKAALSSNGADSVEFLISANPGEEPKPIAKIASGGELSRIMLAVKCVLAGRDDLQTMIFDEIDAGVSGRAARKVAMKLREVSKGRQVICVTHLAQIAAHADEHLLITKSVRDGKTYTEVTRLGFEGRKREIARINSGLDVTELQLKNAEEMLKAACDKGERLKHFNLAD